MGQTTRDGDDRLRKIRALLAKAESTNTHEAEALLAKVADLVARWGIDEALLNDDDVTSGALTPTAITVTVDAPYAVAKTMLVAGVADALGCEAVRLRGRNSSGAVVSIVGFPGDLERAEVLITSLLYQLTNALHNTTPPTSTASATRSWRRSFVAAFASRVSDRLAAQVAETNSEASREADASRSGGARSTAVVLADREESVRAEFRRRFPRVRTSRISVGSSASGAAAGTRAGNAASLATGSIGGARAALTG